MTNHQTPLEKTPRDNAQTYSYKQRIPSNQTMNLANYIEIIKCKNRKFITLHSFTFLPWEEPTPPVTLSFRWYQMWLQITTTCAALISTDFPLTLSFLNGPFDMHHVTTFEHGFPSWQVLQSIYASMLGPNRPVDYLTITIT